MEVENPTLLPHPPSNFNRGEDETFESLKVRTSSTSPALFFFPYPPTTLSLWVQVLIYIIILLSAYSPNLRSQKSRRRNSSSTSESWKVSSRMQMLWSACSIKQKKVRICGLSSFSFPILSFFFFSSWLSHPVSLLALSSFVSFLASHSFLFFFSFFFSYPPVFHPAIHLFLPSLSLCPMSFFSNIPRSHYSTPSFRTPADRVTAARREVAQRTPQSSAWQSFTRECASEVHNSPWLSLFLSLLLFSLRLAISSYIIYQSLLRLPFSLFLFLSFLTPHALSVLSLAGTKYEKSLKSHRVFRASLRKWATSCDQHR